MIKHIINIHSLRRVQHECAVKQISQLNYRTPVVGSCFGGKQALLQVYCRLDNVDKSQHFLLRDAVQFVVLELIFRSEMRIEAQHHVRTQMAFDELVWESARTTQHATRNT